tara:strand:- start:6020 stop:6226 length:207 start_codon:yes stop_codon:yes gene_type:complete
MKRVKKVVIALTNDLKTFISNQKIRKIVRLLIPLNSFIKKHVTGFASPRKLEKNVIKRRNKFSLFINF